MTYAYLNEGNPLPANHKNAGKLGIVIDFEDGTPKQYMYANDQAELADKALKCYSNTRLRLNEVKSSQKPATPTETPAATQMTPEQRIAAAQDITDPAKAGSAVVDLVRDSTGLDLRKMQQQNEEAAAEGRRREAVAQFMRENPSFHPSKRNGGLLRDRVAREFGYNPTAEQFAIAFRDLESEGLIESAPATEQQPGILTPEPSASEPSAPAPSRPSGTGAPPSSRGGGTRPATGLRLTREEVMKMSFENPSEYGRRLTSDPDFAAAVNRVLS